MHFINLTLMTARKTAVYLSNIKPHIKSYSTMTPKSIKKMRKRKFIDTLKIRVKAGLGGQGLPNFGGVGGRGGSVYLVGAHNSSLKVIQNNHNQIVDGRDKIIFQASNGSNSQKMRLLGAPGNSLEVAVPCGITVYTTEGKRVGEVLHEGHKLLVAKGGEGGQPSNEFQHTKGHIANLNLDLKLIADIGLVGFPNAGKSSLIKSLSSVNVNIKPYPFTTIHPQVGMMKYPDLRQISVADLPGLVEGAHHNYGMGHDFLKHMERTKLLLFVVDLHGFQFKVDTPKRNAFESVLILIKEMELSKPELLLKPAVLAINKTDLANSEDMLEDVTYKFKNIKDHLQEIEERLRPANDFKFDVIIPISARENSNINHLKEQLRKLLDVYADEMSETELEKKNENSIKSVNLQLKEHHSSGTWV